MAVSSDGGNIINSAENTINTRSLPGFTSGSSWRTVSYTRRRILLRPTAPFITFLLTTTAMRGCFRLGCDVCRSVMSLDRTVLPWAYTYFKLLWPWNRFLNGIILLVYENLRRFGGDFAYIESFARPFIRRRFKTARPAFEAIRARKP